MSKRIVASEFIGRKFGKLTVIAESKRDNRGRVRWLCQCECGGTSAPQTSNLIRGGTNSCGCGAGLGNPTGNLQHGKSSLREYAIYKAMMRRCYNQKDSHYSEYGERGITVCERWRASLDAFLADMGPRPSPIHSIDRFPDNNGNYEPSNCRWATPTEQARNKRNSRLLKWGDQVKTIAEWSGVTGITVGCIVARLKRKWTIERSLTTPTSCVSRNITHNGETRSLREWAQIAGVSLSTLAYRLKHWPTEDAIAQPARKQPLSRRR